MAGKQMLTVRQVAAQIGLTRSVVTKLILRGYLKAERQGRSWLVSVEALEAFVARAKATMKGVK